MKKMSVFVAVILTMGFFISRESFSQPQWGKKFKGGYGRGVGEQYGRLFDTNTIETIKGEVVSIDIVTPPLPVKGMSGGIHLMVKTDKEEIPVHLGPAWYIENQDTRIELKDIIEVKGSRIELETKTIIIAAEIKKGEECLALRDEKGIPAWSGWRRNIDWKGQGGWGSGSVYGRMFDPKTIETICGKVTKVERITPMKGMSGGIHLTVKTDKEEIAVHLGPAWYIENQDMILEQNDMIEVKGSRITFEGKPAIIAACVKKDSAVLTLRDEKGIPVWSGWRRK
ncbi:MAG: hypothetical protein MRJ65_05200 [Candidatus Brocadiaceae bacterium]|nr:hypothetical protein [Candidatus Brocadiaceae bacterium]